MLRSSAERYFRFNKIFCTAHYRGGYYFFLDKKVAKNQDGKNLLPARPAPCPVFRRAFALYLLFGHREELARWQQVYRCFAKLGMTIVFISYFFTKKFPIASTSICVFRKHRMASSGVQMMGSSMRLKEVLITIGQSVSW